MTGDQLIVAVNPDTGEVLEHLEQQPPEVLAEALDAVQNRQAQLKEWNSALQAELRRRLKLRRARLVVFGDWEVELSRSRESDWDADGLEPVLRQLVDEGVVRAADVADVITRTPVVSRSKAKELVARLDGDARAAVEALCTWREKNGALTVTRSQQLLPAAKQAPPPETPAPPLAAAPPSQPVAPSPIDPSELFA